MKHECLYIMVPDGVRNFHRQKILIGQNESIVG